MEPRKKSLANFLIPFIGGVVLIFLFMHLAVAYEVAKENPIEERKFNVSQFIEILGDRCSPDKFFQIEWKECSPRFLTYGVFCSGLLLLYFATNQKKYISGKEYGTSQWASRMEIKHLTSQSIRRAALAKIRSKKLSVIEKKQKMLEAKAKFSNENNTLYTATEMISLYNCELNANCLIIGGSGSRKTTGYAVPNILQCNSGKYSPSIVCTDPKGGILERTGKFLEEDCGYPIKVLNLKELDKSYCYNPFAYVLSKKYEEQIPTIVENIMKSRQDEQESKQDPFWDQMAQQLLNALFYATYEGFPEEERNIVTVMILFRWFEVTDDDDRVTAPTKLDLFFEAFAEDAEIKSKYGDVNVNPALRAWEDFRTKCKGKTAQGVTATALSKLAPFDEAEIRRIFSKDEMELDMVGERQTALFVILPPTNKRYNFIANLLYTQLFEQVEYCATVKHDQQLPVPIRFFMDEFYNTGKMPNFVNILSYAREFGIGISIILQSLEQLKEMYEKSWGTILDNCDAFLFLGKVRNNDTLKYISELIGKGTFDKKNYSRSKGRQGSFSTNFDKFGRELMDASEIQRMNKKKCLLFINGYNPFYSDKYNFIKHKNFIKTGYFLKSNNYKYKLLDIDVPHGEEKLDTSVYENTHPIALNLDQEAVIKIMQENIMCLNFENGEEVSLCEDEREEYELIQKILEEEEEQLQKNKDILFHLTPLIDLKEDEESISTIIEKLTEQMENIAFVTEESLNEDYILEQLDERSFNEDSVDDDFFEMLDSINLSIYEKGKEENLFV